VKENEPKNYARIAKIMLPKDYLAYKFTGVFSTDYSDASGTLLVDVAHKCWSKEMCKVCGVNMAWLPKLYESYQITGHMLPQFNLPHCVVTAGAGDNAAAAIGTGTVGKGACNISLGTSGTIFLSDDTFSVDSQNALHSFCHADGKWHLMGCILSAASCRKWWLEGILNTTDYAADEREAAQAPISNLYFLPYLSGERSPHNDVTARGAFIGLSHTTTKAQMSRAVLEGVAFALRDCLEVAKANGIHPAYATVCGGGAKSTLWKQIIADVLGVTVRVPQTEQGPSYGAAMLAMVGSGAYATVSEAVKAIVHVKEEIEPNPERVKAYQQKYLTFRRLYPALKGLNG
jgi:xylulokinase